MSSEEESFPDYTGGDEEQLGDLSDVGSPDEGETLEGEDCSWPDKETLKLIDLFREHSQLYDVTHKWYSHRERKLATLNFIANEMGFSMKYLQTRLSSLRTQYTKSKQLLKSGSERLSTRRLRTLHKQRQLLGFLEPHLRKRTSQSNFPRFVRQDSAAEHVPADLPLEDNDDQTSHHRKKPISSGGKAATPAGTQEPSGSRTTPMRRKYTDAFRPIEVTDSESDVEVAGPSKIDSSSVAKNSASVRRRQTLHRKEETLVEVMTKAFQNEGARPVDQPMDEISLFTQRIGMQLRSVKDPKKVAIMQNSIENALFQCQMQFWGNTSTGSAIDIEGGVANASHLDPLNKPVGASVERQHKASVEIVNVPNKSASGLTPTETLRASGSCKSSPCDVAQLPPQTTDAPKSCLVEKTPEVLEQSKPECHPASSSPVANVDRSHRKPKSSVHKTGQKVGKCSRPTRMTLRNKHTCKDANTREDGATSGEDQHLPDI